MATTSKHTVRNIAKGPRGLNTVGGYVEIQPGQTLKGVELVEAEFESAERTGNFHFDKDAKADDKADQAAAAGDGLPSNPMQLKKLARDENIDVGGATTAADLQRVILDGRKTKVDAAAAAAGAPPPPDDLDAMDDDTLRATVQAITGSAPAADADRATLLALARGQ